MGLTDAFSLEPDQDGVKAQDNPEQKKDPEGSRRCSRIPKTDSDTALHTSQNIGYLPVSIITSQLA
jgi:hypothetical protein